MTSTNDTLALRIPIQAAVQQETTENRIQRAVADVEKSLGSDVVRIRYELSTNWCDEPAVYFRIILSDAASTTKTKVWEICNRVKDEIDERVDFGALGLARYHHVRSASEQAALKEEAWA